MQYMTEYETTVVLRPDIDGDTVEATLDKMREVLRLGGGKLLEVEHWGKKKLAYDIDKHHRGIYVRTHYLGQNALVSELERNLRNAESILRYLTISLSDKVLPDEHTEKPYVRPQYDVEESVVEETFGASDLSETDIASSDLDEADLDADYTADDEEEI